MEVEDRMVRALTDAELLAELTRRDVAKVREALDLAGGIVALRDCSKHEAREMLGAGGARKLDLIVELAIRLASTPMRIGERLASAEQVYRAYGPRMFALGQEAFVVLPLDARHRLAGEPVTTAIGHITGVDVHPREVFRPLIKAAAARCVVMHAHPSSGDPEPSPQDLALTERLVQVGAVVGIPLVDHVVIGASSWVSLRDRGLVQASI